MYYYRVVGIRDTFRIVSNIDSVIVYSEKDVGPLIERINVFPNPFANSIDIKIENIKSPMTVSIYDMLGRMIYEGLLVENHHRVDASNFTGGVYFLRILRGSDRLYKNLMIQVKEK